MADPHGDVKHGITGFDVVGHRLPLVGSFTYGKE
jgi:hypothetical protein